MKNSISLSIVAALLLSSGLLFFFSCRKENQPATQSPRSGSTTLNLVPVGALSVSRSFPAVATAGNKIFFAGGSSDQDGSVFSRVDVYDISTETWSIMELSEARAGIGAVTVGNKVIFAGGGRKFDFGWWSWDSISTRVDIYDVVENSWTTTEMPEPAIFLFDYGVTGTVGTRAFFYSGYASSDPVTPTVFIYDVTTNLWSSQRLSESSYKNGTAMASLGNQLLIAGGVLLGGVFFNDFLRSKVVDIYDTAANSWHTDSLSTARSYIKSATLGNKAFFAGGQLDAGAGGSFSDIVDIYDNTSKNWTVEHLSRATILAGAASASQKVLFFGGDTVDVYNASSHDWSIARISESFSDPSAIISAGNNIYATNGGTVWRIPL